MLCPNGCELPMEEKKVEKLFHRNSEPVIISELTIYICKECGQEAIPLRTARIIEDVLNEKVNPSGKFTAELYEVSSL